MHSTIKTVKEYLETLPPERRESITKVRKVILQNLPKGYEEVMNWGIICYEVPLEACPENYNGKPLMYASLASQKRHMSVHISSLYCDKRLLDWFMTAYGETGKKLNMGKSCVRFTKLENLPLELIGKTIAMVSVKDFVASYKASLNKK